MASQSLAEALEEVFRRCRGMDAPLGDRLQVMADAVRALSAPFAEAVDRLVDRLQRSGAGAAAPGPDDPMPGFVLPDETGRLTSLDEILERGPAAVVFQRGHWCPYCRIGSAALAQSQHDVQAAGGQIVTIMPDREPFAAELKAEAAAEFPFLTDVDNGYALSLNLAIWVGAELERMMDEAGWRLPAWQGSDTWMLPIPATFVVGTDGRVKARFVDPDYRKRMAIEDMVAALADAD